MSKKLQSIRGMHDILPADIAGWQLLESYLLEVMDAYAYTEIRLPIVEKTELFSRSIGDVTDIVEKEMYTFEDRNGDSLSLRPEGTAGCVRAGIEHGLLHNQTQRLWYMGPMFRHEKPQKGRYRQFHQLGAEAYGIPGPDIDAELIFLVERLWKRLGLSNICLQINTLGTLEERRAYRQVLVDYFSKASSQLDEDSQRRLHSNPLRILDSKNPDMQVLIENAPTLMDHLGAESQAHFDGVRGYLDTAGIEYEINPRLVRGLDYYSHTVFEWVSDSLGAQGTVCAGGRYDGLIAQLGGRPSAAVGWAMGLERLLAILQQQEGWQPFTAPDLYIVYAGEALAQQAMILAETIRDDLPELSIMCHCGTGTLKSQFKQADKSGAEYALILGEAELQNNQYAFKPLREESEQQLIPAQSLIAHLQKTFNF